MRPSLLYAEDTEPVQDYFATTWGPIKSFIQAVHGLQFSGHSFEELYSGVLNIVTLGKGGELYAALKVECSRHIANVVAAIDKPTQACGTRVFKLYMHTQK